MSMRPLHRMAATSASLLIVLLVGSCGGGSCSIIPGGGPCAEPMNESGGIDDPYLAGTAISSVPSGISALIGGLSASGRIEPPRGFHIFGVLSGTTTIGLATASAIRNRDREARYYLTAPIIAGLFGVPALTLGILGLLSPAVAAPPRPEAMHCEVGNCRPGIPEPIILMDTRGNASPGVQLIGGRF